MRGVVSNYVYFNFQSLNCDPSVPANDRMVVTGVRIIDDTGSGQEITGCPDLALIGLLEPFPYHFNTYWAGWRLTEDYRDLPSDLVTVIHHPFGDIKKVTESETDKVFLEGDPECFRIKVTDGTFEGGSSGAPAFDEDHFVIGVERSILAPTPSCDLEHVQIGNLFFA